MVRARISTIMLKTGRLTFGAAFAGLGIIVIAGLTKSWLVMTYGVALSAGGIGGGMVISAILYQLQTGGMLECPNKNSTTQAPITNT